MTGRLCQPPHPTPTTALHGTTLPPKTDLAPSAVFFLRQKPPRQLGRTPPATPPRQASPVKLLREGLSLSAPQRAAPRAHRKSRTATAEPRPQGVPVAGVGGKAVALDHCEGGHSVAQDVGTPQQWYPVVEDDGGREPGQDVGVGEPEQVRDEPRLQAVDLVLVDKPCGGRQKGQSMSRGATSGGSGPACFRGLGCSGPCSGTPAPDQKLVRGYYNSGPRSKCQGCRSHHPSQDCLLLPARGHSTDDAFGPEGPYLLVKTAVTVNM